MSERAVKEKLKKILSGAKAWFFMPVSNGMGRHGIPDVVGVHDGRFFAIEVKDQGRRDEENRGASKLQKHEIERIIAAGGMAMVWDGENDDVEELYSWLKDEEA